MRSDPPRRSLSPALRATIGLHGAAPLLWLLRPDAAGWIAGGLLANHAILACAGMCPGSTLLGPNLKRLPEGSIERGEVALTFDDGPDPAVTPYVLDLLDSAGAQATFFCIGEAVRVHPGLAREIASRGHRVENHSLTHPNAFACYPPRWLRREVVDAQAAIADITGSEPAYFRAPMGLRNPFLDPVLAEAGLFLTSWTRRALDGVSGDAARGLHRLTRGLAAGDILLMHDGFAVRCRDCRPVVLDILPGLLRRCRDSGLRPAALPSP